MALVPATSDFWSVVLSDDFQEDPYPWLHALRSEEPLHQPAFELWLVTRHVDVAAAVRNPQLSTDPRNANLQLEGDACGRVDIDEGVMLFLDPPDHTRMRSLVSKAFTPRSIERLRPRVTEVVDRLLDEAVARSGGRFDVIEDLAYPLPVTIICEMLGVPAEDHAQFADWSRVLAGSLDPAPLHTAEQQQAIGQAAERFSAYFDDLIARRRRSLGDDLLSGLIAAEEDGDRLNGHELRNTGMFLLVAGHETTVNLVGNGVLALLRHPDQLARLVGDPGMMRPAVDELLRYDSAVQLTTRIALTDYPIGEVTVPAGQRLTLLLAAANRDPEVFAEPDRLDLGRENASRHVAFGGGHHFCLGAALARLEGEIAIGRLVQRFPHLELTESPTRRQMFTLRGLDHLVVSTGW